VKTKPILEQKTDVREQRTDYPEEIMTCNLQVLKILDIKKNKEYRILNFKLWILTPVFCILIFVLRSILCG